MIDVNHLLTYACRLDGNAKRVAGLRRVKIMIVLVLDAATAVDFHADTCDHAGLVRTQVAGRVPHIFRG